MAPRTNVTSAPLPDELEVSVFGPGVGECVVVHLGAGDWLVVDSCRNRRTRRPVALDYLRGLRVEVSTAVKLVVATHWHNDHMAGLADILDASSEAKFSCSAALRTREFFEIVAAAGRGAVGAFGTGFEEIGRILDALLTRSEGRGRKEAVGPNWALHDKRLFQRPSVKGVPGAEVWSLSPSSGTLSLAFRELADCLPREGSPKRHAVSQSPNELAVVLWIDVGHSRVLLGADLENAENPLTGWKAIVSSITRPSGRAVILKVPHHGSSDADSPEMWREMLSPSPYAVVTPFVPRRLPTGSDLRRLSGRTPNLLCSARAGGWSPPNRGGAVEKTAETVARNRRAVEGPIGHVRLRSQAQDSVSVELFSGAFQVRL